MNPDLEFFLEDAFDGLKPTLANVGRVVVEPDYDLVQRETDKQALAEELKQLLADQKTDASALSSPDGQAVQIPESLTTLAKYIRTISLHGDSVEGSWIEVAPPGNWI